MLGNSFAKDGQVPLRLGTASLVRSPSRTKRGPLSIAGDSIRIFWSGTCALVVNRRQSRMGWLEYLHASEILRTD